MPFDDTNYRQPQDFTPSPRPAPRMSKREELLLLISAFVLALAGLLLPISAGALVDLAHVVQRQG